MLRPLPLPFKIFCLPLMAWDWARNGAQGNGRVTPWSRNSWALKEISTLLGLFTLATPSSLPNLCQDPLLKIEPCGWSSLGT